MDKDDNVWGTDKGQDKLHSKGMHCKGREKDRDGGHNQNKNLIVQGHEVVQDTGRR